MTKITNLGTSAFYELQEATKKAKISFDDFETAISKVFPKQAEYKWTIFFHIEQKTKFKRFASKQSGTSFIINL